MATTQEQAEAEAMLQGQADIWRYMFGFADSMALKCAVELRIADTINSHGGPITLSQIISTLDSPSPDITCLARIMRLLVRRKIFAAYPQSDDGETLYGLTHSSRYLLRDAELNLVPIILMENHPWAMNPWHCFSSCVREGGIAFKKANGCEIWDFAAENPEFNKMFNDGMACAARITIRAIMSGYKDGFGCIGSLVDVGGGTGAVVAEIVKAYPHIKGINFDLPHVIATAPVHQGICHVGGDMFAGIPTADAVFMEMIQIMTHHLSTVQIQVEDPHGINIYGTILFKPILPNCMHRSGLQWIMHDWSNEDCVKILKNCRKAIPEKTGKVIIVDLVLQPDGNGVSDDTGLVSDLAMIAHSSGGKERTELEWKIVLEEGGFPHYKIIKIPALPSIIEAYPE